MSYSGWSTSKYVQPGAGAAASSCTIAAWVKLSSLSALDTIATLYSGTAGRYVALQVNTSGKALALLINGASSKTATGATTLSTGVWYHLVARFTSATTQTIYVNGVSDGTDATALAGGAYGSPVFDVGIDSTLLLAAAASIGEVALWTGGLSAEDAAALAAGVSPLLIRPDTLVAYNPLLADPAINYVGSTTVTGSPTQDADHPPVIYGRRRQRIVPFLSTTTTLTPGLLTNAQSFFSPKIIETLKPGLFANSQSFFSPKLIATLKPALFSNSQTFFGPTLKRTLKPGLFTNSQAFYAPYIFYRARPSLLTNTQSFFTPKLVETLKPGLFSNAQAFYAPTVRVTLKPALLSNAQSFYSPSLKTTLKPGLFTNAQVFYAPHAYEPFAPGLFTNAQAFYTPKLIVRLKPGILTNVQAFYSPTAVAGALLPSLLTNAQVFYAPKLTVTIKPSALLNAQTFYGPTVQDAGAIATTVPILGGDDAWPLAERKERRWEPGYPKLREEIEEALNRIRGIVAPVDTTTEVKAVVRAVKVAAPYLEPDANLGELLKARQKLEQLETALIAYEQARQEDEDDDDLLLLAA